MLPASSEALDAAILAQAGPQWRKVAMVLARTGEAFGSLTEREFEALGARLNALVASGKLVAQGDISRWRDSEVRLPA